MNKAILDGFVLNIQGLIYKWLVTLVKWSDLNTPLHKNCTKS